MNTRIFNFSEPVLLEHAGEIGEYLIEDLPQYTAFDPDLNEEKRQNLLDYTNKALGLGTDSTQVGILEGKTATMKSVMQTCFKRVETLRYFVNKKFGGNEVMVRQFKFNEYNKARKSQTKLIVYMYELAKIAGNFRTDLVSAGMKEDDIAAIQTAAEALNQANTTQETGKGERVMSTSERNALLNDIYSLLMDFNRASKIVFADDPIRRERYVMPYTNSGIEETAEVEQTSDTETN